MTTIDIDAIRQREQAATPGPWDHGNDGLVWPPRIGDPVSGSTELADAEFIAHARTDVPALLAKVDELTAALAERDTQLTAANRRADGAENDQRALIADKTALANENAELREQFFAQKPVIDAALAWAEMCEDGGLAPDDCRKSEDALHDAVESYRLMDLALTTARTQAGVAR